MEGLVEHALEVATHALVDLLEAAVVEAVLDEAGILPGTVEQDAGQSELGDPHQVLRERPARNPIGVSKARDRSGQSRNIDVWLDLAGECLKLQTQPLLMVGVEVEISQEPIVLGGCVLSKLLSRARAIGSTRNSTSICERRIHRSSLTPGLSLCDKRDLLVNPHRAEAE